MLPADFGDNFNYEYRCGKKGADDRTLLFAMERSKYARPHARARIKQDGDEPECVRGIGVMQMASRDGSASDANGNQRGRQEHVAKREARQVHSVHCTL